MKIFTFQASSVRGENQDESMLYESNKLDDCLPLIGVNTYLPNKGEAEEAPEIELIRATEAEKHEQIKGVQRFQRRHVDTGPDTLRQLQQTARERGNTFASLMEAVKVASLGQISAALYQVGGEYRRNM
ncbi:MAG: hypothetical protein Tsb0027_10100 [Wenzhouxiangellaceae bacterium]